MKFYETIWSYLVSNFQKLYACTHSYGYYTWKSCLKSAMSKSLKWFSNFIDWDSSAVPAVHGNVGIFQCGHINTSHPLDSVTCAWLLETCLWNWLSLWRPCCPNLWNFPTLAHSNRKIKAKWRPFTKMLKHKTEKFMTERTYFILHLHSGLCNRTTTCRKTVIFWKQKNTL